MPINNAYLLCTTIKGDSVYPEDFVRKDYTKVGLLYRDITVYKKWDDDNNRDGVRPESVKFTLYSNGEARDEVLLPKVAEDGTLIWEHTFKSLPYYDYEGDLIRYTVEEEAVEDYSTVIDKLSTDEYQFTNIHEPERTTVSGHKIWEGDSAEDRPDYLTIKLYADGVFLKSMNIRANGDGYWTYEFTNLLKYRDGGIPIVYTVEEVVTSKTASYLDPEYDGLDIINRYHPYGDLYVKKTVSNYDDLSDNAIANGEFTFAFYFTREVDGEEAPVLEEYRYEVLDLVTGDKLREGTLTYGDSVKIRHNEQIHVIEVDQYVQYEVVEQDLPAGYEHTSSSNAAGTIRPNNSVYAAINNEYEATGRYSPQAEKRLYNQILKRYQFFFYLYEGELTREEIAEGDIKAIRSAASGDPQTIIDEEGNIEYYYAPVTFGGLVYSHLDDGKTYTYTILEQLADTDGYTYDESIYYVDVTIEDNGDGTMKVTPVYYRYGDDGRENVDFDEVVFENVYEAEGSIVLNAWKDLKGRRLTEEDVFTFELLDEEGKLIVLDVEQEDGSIAQVEEIKENDISGTVTFDEIKYDQNDIGKSYYYIVHEIKGDREDVTYAEDYFAYRVDV
ncbi:MAG: Cna B-type domain-containing protein, partial [Erysipelotrichaceae bacterium]|nr:Cna B-type domain-containing protein [Erysipelotrichaceae bacterium]